nr:T9SS type A sorting domain-containing protein [Ignavibacteria bacterium]
PLPVELSLFSSSVNENDVILNWVTTSELNNSGFDIERSKVNASDNEWLKIGFVKGNGTSSNTNTYEYTDKNVNSGKYNYRLKQIDFNGNFKYYNLSEEVTVGIPGKYSLNQNFPNPFNPETIISYQIPSDHNVLIKIYDISGKEVLTLVNEYEVAGSYEIKFNGSNFASGIYYYQIEAGEFKATKKMLLVK